MAIIWTFSSPYWQGDASSRSYNWYHVHNVYKSIYIKLNQTCNEAWKSIELRLVMYTNNDIL